MNLKVGDKILFIRDGKPFFVKDDVWEIFQINNEHIVVASDEDSFKNMNMFHSAIFSDQDLGVWFSLYQSINFGFSSENNVKQSGYIPISLVDNTICIHDMTSYTGLSKKYDYCTKCSIETNHRGIWE